MKPDVKKIIAYIKATKGNRKYCNGLAGTLQDDNYASSICKYVKTVTPERIDLLIEYAEKLEAEVTDMAVQLANAESKCRELAAAENNLIDSEFHVAELEEYLRDKQALLEESERRIAELDERTPYGYLRQCDGQIQISIGSERPHDRSGGYATPWFAIYTAAGIGVKGGMRCQSHQ